MTIDQSMNDFLTGAQTTAASVDVRAGFNANWPPAGRYESAVTGVASEPGDFKGTRCMVTHFSYALRVTNDPNIDPEKVWEFQGRDLRLVPNYDAAFPGDENKNTRKACEIAWSDYIKALSLISGLDIDATKSDLSAAAMVAGDRLSKSPPPVVLLMIKVRQGNKGGTFPEEKMLDIINP